MAINGNGFFAGLKKAQSHLSARRLRAIVSHHDIMMGQRVPRHLGFAWHHYDKAVSTYILLPSTWYNGSGLWLWPNEDCQFAACNCPFDFIFAFFS